MKEDLNNMNRIVPNALFFEIIQEDLEKGKSVKFTVAGNSMKPFLAHGDQVIIKQPNESNVKKGDILLAKYQGKVILHRLVKIEGDNYHLAGDGNLAQIEVVTKDNVLASVIEGKRNEKLLKVTTDFNKKLGLIWFYIRPLRFILSKFK